MRKTLSLGLFFLALMGATSLLTACHTTEGVGQDISATGHAVTNGAAKATP